MSDKSPVLSGWKQIADFIGRDREAAKLYYEDFGMPVMRLKNGTVMSTRGLILSWITKNARLVE